MTIFETVVTGTGIEAEAFRKEKTMILSGDEAPETLTDYCYKIELNQVGKGIACDMRLCFDRQMYIITVVGDVIQANLNELGHVTIKFDGSHELELPGTMYIEDKEVPYLRKGIIIKIDQEDQNGGKLYGNHA